MVLCLCLFVPFHAHVGGVFDHLDEMDLTPFGTRPERALDVTIFEEKWPPLETKNKRAKEFQKLASAHGKLTGNSNVRVDRLSLFILLIRSVYLCFFYLAV